MGPPPTLAHHMAVTHNLRVKVDVDMNPKIQGVSTQSVSSPTSVQAAILTPHHSETPDRRTSTSFLNLGPSSAVTQLSTSTLLQASGLMLLFTVVGKDLWLKKTCFEFHS